VSDFHLREGGVMLNKRSKSPGELSQDQKPGKDSTFGSWLFH
jgi:hypothetical protein